MAPRPVRCLIGCGSNLGQRRPQLEGAIDLLASTPGVTVRAVSEFRETRPVGGPAGQAAFLNAACLMETDLGPEDLLVALAAVEAALHRDRRERWAARTIDLDLLIYDGLICRNDVLTVPHPRMATRRFVLEPAVEIAPDLPYPLAGCTLRELLDSISAPCPMVAVVGVPESGAADIAAAVAAATCGRLIAAPGPAPRETDGADAWLEAAERWTDRLRDAAAGAADGPRGGLTIASFWPGCLAVAAEDLPPPARCRFEEGLRAAPPAPVPHAAIVVRRKPAALAAGARLQERLLRRLACPHDRLAEAPRAVVVVDSDDPGRAVHEAIAAVEAMLR